MKNKNLKKNVKAVALISVLIIIAMLAILVLTFFQTMRIEHRSAVTFADTQQTKMVSQGAVAHAIELLRTNIPEPASIDKSATTADAENWTINPGLLTIEDEAGLREVHLHTGIVDDAPSSTNDPDVHSVNLNESIPGKDVPTICYQQDDLGQVDVNADFPEMRVKWVNILKDPSKPADKDNPIVSRHAFWIDDESGKINFNTAMGKPEPGEDASFDRQRAMGFMPATFAGGTADMRLNNSNTEPLRFGLGRPSSVNLDALFESSDEVDIEKLATHSFLRGYSRYPEAILSFLDMSDIEKQEWLQRNQYDMTFYSRSPEFNAFGRPRFMATNLPSSLEGGPYYQMPFVYNQTGGSTTRGIDGILHLSGLMGSLGFTDVVDGGTTDAVRAGNVVNRAQAEMLMRYFDRNFPGYNKSFIDKYGELECAQIALNILNMARISTTGLRNRVSVASGGGFSRDYGYRSTSVLYSPSTAENARRGTPERYFWMYDESKPLGSGFLTSEERQKINDNFESSEEGWQNDFPTRMIPSSPGPHVMEVRMLFKPELVETGYASSFPDFVFTDSDGRRSERFDSARFLKIRLQAEYYMHELGPDTDIREFPVQTDYLKLEIIGGMDNSGTFDLANSPSEGSLFINEFGPPTANWQDLQDINASGTSRHTNWPWNDRNWTWNPANRARTNPDGTPALDAEGEPLNETNLRSLGDFSITPARQPNVPLAGYAFKDGIRNDSNKIFTQLGRNRRLISSAYQRVGRFVDRSVPVSRLFGNLPDNNSLSYGRDMPRLFHEDDTLTIRVKYRGGMSIRGDRNRVRQMWPVGEGEENVLEAEITISMSDITQEGSISWQISDPRLSGNKDMWTAMVEDSSNDAGTPAAVNTNVQNENGIGVEPADSSDEKSKFRYVQRTPIRNMKNQLLLLDQEKVQRPTEYDTDSVVSSKGFWAFIPTGIQGKNGGPPIPWRTFALNFDDDELSQQDSEYPPDYLLMNLMGNTYPMQRAQTQINKAQPDEFSTLSFMHSTAGAINLNSKPYPDNQYFNAPQRTRPLKAVFKGLRSDSDIDALVQSIGDYQDQNRFMYVGDLSRVSGYATGDTEFEREDLLRNMVGSLTTQSNTFGVWGVAQVVQKIRDNEEYGTFEDGDRVRGEKRFFALVERFIWPGVDGVPGNAHVSSSGKWDRHVDQTQDVRDITTGTNDLFQLPGSPPTKANLVAATGDYNVVLDKTGSYPEFDGPQEVELDKYTTAVFGNLKPHRVTPLEDAYNPPQPVIKYKVVYFKYLDE